MDIEIPTKIQIIKDVIERRGGEVNIEGDIKRIVKQPKGIEPIANKRFGRTNYVELTKLIINEGELSIKTTSSTWSLKEAKIYLKQLQTAIRVIHEVEGLQEVYQNIKENSEKRSKA